MKIDDAAILTWHRELTAIPSVSGSEAECIGHAEVILRRYGVSCRRLGRNLLARVPGHGPRLLLNTHLDTVPPTASWSRDPYRVESIDGRVYGLGSNDAKASAAAMMAAIAAESISPTGCDLALLLVVDEETGGAGTELAWPILRSEGWEPEGVIVGEPTGLEIVLAQRGMMVLSLEASAPTCHAAHAKRLGARNVLVEMARDILRLEEIEVGVEDRFLGKTTLTPTVVSGGKARNSTPDLVQVIVDVRTVPGRSHEEIAAEIRRAVSADVKVLSSRLEPRICPPDAAIALAASRAHKQPKFSGSATMSDLVFFGDGLAVKCGPGQTIRSHRPDEFVEESEILEGAAFYARLIQEFYSARSREMKHDATLG